MNSIMNKWMMGALVAAGVLMGCVNPTPRLDAKFGDAVIQAKAQQTINPDAPLNSRPTVGLDGKAASGIMDRYHKAYETPTPVQSGAIGVVTGGGTTLK